MKIKTDKKAGVLYRSAEIDKASIDLENHTLVLSFASTNPADRYFGKEILRVSPEAMRTTRLDNVMSLLYNHNPDELLGRVLDYKFENNKAYATVKFGSTERCMEAFTLACEGILVNTSFMYKVYEVIKLEDMDGVPAYEVIDFEPLEISLVTIPADETTGVGRSFKRSDDILDLDINDYLEDNTEKDIKETVQVRTEEIIPEVKTEIKAVEVVAEEKATPVKAEETQQEPEAQKQEVAQPEQVIAPVTTPFIDVQENIASKNITTKEPIKMNKTSLTNLVSSILRKDDTSAEYFQRGQEFAKANGKNTFGNVVCMDDIATRAGEFIQSDAASGGNLVAPNYRPEMLVNVIQNKTTLKEAGVEFITASGGNLIIPTASFTGGATWADEIETAPFVTFNSDQIESTQKRLTASVDVSKAMILNGAVDVNKLIQDVIAEQFAVKLDYTAYQGTGIGKVPLGILNHPAVQAQALATPTTRANILEMIKKLEKSNMLGTAFVMSPEMKYALSLVDIGTAGNRFLFDEFTNQVAGYRTVISNNVPDNKLILSNWSDIKVIDYSMLDITVDEISKAGNYLVRITFNAFYDIVHTRPTNTVVGTKD